MERAGEDKGVNKRRLDRLYIHIRNSGGVELVIVFGTYRAVPTLDWPIHTGACCFLHGSMVKSPVLTNPVCPKRDRRFEVL